MSRLPHMETGGRWGLGQPGKAGPRLSVQQALICFFSKPSDEAPGATPLSRVGDAGGKPWTNWPWDAQIPACDIQDHGPQSVGEGGGSWDPRTICLSREDQAG